MSAQRTGVIAGKWTADPSATEAQFRARDVLRRTVVGTLSVLSASVEVSADGTPMHVAAVLDLASVATGSTRRDADLRGPRFFDVQGDALLRMTAGPAQPGGSHRWLLAGELTMKGTCCPLDITAELVDLDDGRAHVRATAVFDRRDAGITVPRLLVGRAVAIEVDACLRAPESAES